MKHSSLSASVNLISGANAENHPGTITVNRTPGQPQTPVTITLKTENFFCESQVSDEDARRLAARLKRISK